MTIKAPAKPPMIAKNEESALPPYILTVRNESSNSIISKKTNAIKEMDRTLKEMISKLSHTAIIKIMERIIKVPGR